MPSNALARVEEAQNRGLIITILCVFSASVTIVSIVGLIIGAVYHDQCAIDSRIPIFLIVHCVITIVVYGPGLIVVCSFYFVFCYSNIPLFCHRLYIS